MRGYPGIGGMYRFRVSARWRYVKKLFSYRRAKRCWSA